MRKLTREESKTKLEEITEQQLEELVRYILDLEVSLANSETDPRTDNNYDRILGLIIKLFGLFLARKIGQSDPDALGSIMTHLHEKVHDCMDDEGNFSLEPILKLDNYFVIGDREELDDIMNLMKKYKQSGTTIN